MQRIIPSTRNHARRRGAALVEFAVLAPLFFAILIGIIEFGRAIMVAQLMTNASREGARRAIIEGATETEVKDLVSNYLTNSSVGGATVSVSPSNLSSAGFGDNVTVSVSVPYEDVSWVPSSWFLSGRTLQAKAVMQAERLQ